MSQNTTVGNVFSDTLTLSVLGTFLSFGLEHTVQTCLNDLVSATYILLAVTHLILEHSELTLSILSFCHPLPLLYLIPLAYSNTEAF